MNPKFVAAGLAIALLMGCTDARINRIAASRSTDVVAFNDQIWRNVWVLCYGSQFFRLGRGDFCVTPNGRYVISTTYERPDRVLIAELAPCKTRISTVRVNNLPPGVWPGEVECNDVRALVQYYRDGNSSALPVEALPRLWKQIRLADLHISDATQVDWDGLPPQAAVLGEEVGKGERQFKVSKDLVIVEKSAPVGANRILLESGGKRTLLAQEDAWTVLFKWFPELGFYPL